MARALERAPGSQVSKGSKKNHRQHLMDVGGPGVLCYLLEGMQRKSSSGFCFFKSMKS